MQNNPISYLGGSLLYTKKTDYRLKSISMTVRYCKELATALGQLLDSDPTARQKILGGEVPHDVNPQATSLQQPASQESDSSGEI